jgi:hypothetical protein
VPLVLSQSMPNACTWLRVAAAQEQGLISELIPAANRINETMPCANPFRTSGRGAEAWSGSGQVTTSFEATPERFTRSQDRRANGQVCALPSSTQRWRLRNCGREMAQNWAG